MKIPFFIIIILAVGALAGFFYFFNRTDTPTISLVPEEEEEEIIIDTDPVLEEEKEAVSGIWQTYKNEKYYYQFNYPENYRLADLIIKEKALKDISIREEYREQFSADDFLVLTNLSPEQEKEYLELFEDNGHTMSQSYYQRNFPDGTITIMPSACKGKSVQEQIEKWGTLREEQLIDISYLYIDFRIEQTRSGLEVQRWKSNWRAEDRKYEEASIAIPKEIQWEMWDYPAIYSGSKIYPCLSIEMPIGDNYDQDIAVFDSIIASFTFMLEEDPAQPIAEKEKKIENIDFVKLFKVMCDYQPWCWFPETGTILKYDWEKAKNYPNSWWEDGDNTKDRIFVQNMISAVEYVDLNGDGSKEAVVSIHGGGKAGLSPFQVFELTGEGDMVEIEVVRDNWRYEVSYMGSFYFKIRDNLIIEEFSVYHKHDPRCCPSLPGIKIKFQWDDGKVVSIGVDEEDSYYSRYYSEVGYCESLDFFDEDDYLGYKSDLQFYKKGRIGEIITFNHLIACGYFSRQGTYLILEDRDKKTVPEYIGRESISYDGSGVDFYAEKFSPLGNFLIYRENSHAASFIKIYDIEKKEIVKDFPGPHTFGFTHDEQYFYACADHGYHVEKYAEIYNTKDFSLNYALAEEEKVKDDYQSRYAIECHYNPDRNSITYHLKEGYQDDEVEKIIEYLFDSREVKEIK